MNRFGFNINLRMTPENIRDLGEKCLGTDLYHAIEVTYYENMEHVDTTEYNQAIIEIVEKYHPQVIVHISDFNLAEENQVLRGAIVEEIKNCIKYTKYLGGNEIVIHSGNRTCGMHVPIFHEDGSRPTPEEVEQKAWGLSVELMKVACELAQEEGILLYTENLNGNANTLTMEEVLRYVEDVHMPNLKVVFDVGHSHQMGQNYVADVLAAKGMLAHLHIHDNHGFSDEHAALGEGTIDYKTFVEALSEVNYQGIYMMEIGLCTVENLTASRDIILASLEKE